MTTNSAPNGDRVPSNLPAKEHLVNVRGTQILAADTRERYRQKIARITLDSMAQFVGLLDASGTVLEINQVALDAVGIKLSDVEGLPFWTTFWWQVSEQINATLREMIARAARGEFVRWDAEIYGRAGGKETIIIDASLMPVKDAEGQVVFIAAEGRDITEKKAYEREIARQREELAKLDVLKTQFFANISHEFRTPLTLMLGPLEDVLENRYGSIPVEAAENLATSHRNSLRLLKLVNALLDFSRIEAGRIQASYEPTDLRSLTAELASNFRSLCDKAGLRLIVDCEAFNPKEPAYVDGDMWEKIVLNLLSNAFKFTLQGTITVRLVEDNGQARLTVQDTGVGIPPEELPRMFERFHRIEQNLGRTHEGTGIGLALVLELVKLHGGTIDVTSERGEGSTFTVMIPLGKAHLPPDKILSLRTLSSTAVAHASFVEEASRWLSGAPEVHEGDAPPKVQQTSDSIKARILWADDNADMRAYVSRLLANQFDVETLEDGKAALDAALANPPDLILADIMMPKLDGFGLLAAVRSSPTLREIPIILLSARAGEESKIEGIAAGADDYLVKPFSANELLARIETALKLKRVREEARDEILRSEARFRAFVTASSDVVYRMSPDWSEMRHLQGHDFIEDTEDPMRGWLEKYIHVDDRDHVLTAIRKAIDNKSVFELEHRVVRVDGTLGWTLSRAVPLLRSSGEIVEWLGTAQDITARKNAQDQIHEASERLRFMAESMPQKITTTKPDGSVDYMNAQWTEYTGMTWDELRDRDWNYFTHPDDVEETKSRWSRSLGTGDPYTVTRRLRRADGEYRWHLSRAHAMRDHDGKITMWIGSTTDIHDQILREQELRRANQALERFAYSASHDLQEPLRSVRIYSELITVEFGDKFAGDALQYLEHVNAGAARMEMLVKDLLLYAQTSLLEKPSEPVDSSEIAQMVLFDLAGAITESGAVVNVEPLPQVSVHATHLQQLFQNLIGNAIKYRRKDETAVIHLSATPRRGDWLFAVRDNGIGIKPQYKERIFELFKRLHTNDQYSGTGVGLAICQRIVEHYDGRIWVESDDCKGSTFYFILPG